MYWKLEMDCIIVAQENSSLLDFTWQYIISVSTNFLATHLLICITVFQNYLSKYCKLKDV